MFPWQRTDFEICFSGNFHENIWIDTLIEQIQLVVSEEHNFEYEAKSYLYEFCGKLAFKFSLQGSNPKTWKTNNILHVGNFQGSNSSRLFWNNQTNMQFLSFSAQPNRFPEQGSKSQLFCRNTFQTSITDNLEVDAKIILEASWEKTILKLRELSIPFEHFGNFSPST